MATDKKWHMHKKRRVQNFSEIGDAFEVLPGGGGGGKNSNFSKKGAIFKVSLCNESKTIFNLARSKIAVLGLQNIILKLILYWYEDFRSRFGSG